MMEVSEHGLEEGSARIFGAVSKSILEDWKSLQNGLPLISKSLTQMESASVQVIGQLREHIREVVETQKELEAVLSVKSGSHSLLEKDLPALAPFDYETLYSDLWEVQMEQEMDSSSALLPPPVDLLEFDSLAHRVKKTVQTQGEIILKEETAKRLRGVGDLVKAEPVTPSRRRPSPIREKPGFTPARIRVNVKPPVAPRVNERTEPTMPTTNPSRKGRMSEELPENDRKGIPELQNDESAPHLTPAKEDALPAKASETKVKEESGTEKSDPGSNEMEKEDRPQQVASSQVSAPRDSAQNHAAMEVTTKFNSKLGGILWESLQTSLHAVGALLSQASASSDSRGLVHIAQIVTLISFSVSCSISYASGLSLLHGLVVERRFALYGESDDSRNHYVMSCNIESLDYSKSGLLPISQAELFLSVYAVAVVFLGASGTREQSFRKSELVTAVLGPSFRNPLIDEGAVALLLRAIKLCSAYLRAANQKGHSRQEVFVSSVRAAIGVLNDHSASSPFSSVVEMFLVAVAQVLAYHGSHMQRLSTTQINGIQNIVSSEYKRMGRTSSTIESLGMFALMTSFNEQFIRFEKVYVSFAGSIFGPAAHQQLLTDKFLFCHTQQLGAFKTTPNDLVWVKRTVEETLNAASYLRNRKTMGAVSVVLEVISLIKNRAHSTERDRSPASANVSAQNSSRVAKLPTGLAPADDVAKGNEAEASDALRSTDQEKATASTIYDWTNSSESGEPEIEFEIHRIKEFVRNQIFQGSLPGKILNPGIVDAMATGNDAVLEELLRPSIPTPSTSSSEGEEEDLDSDDENEYYEDENSDGSEDE